MKLPSRLPALALALLAAAGLGAQDLDLKLDEVSITAERIGSRTVEAPASTTVVTREDIEARAASTVVQAIESVPGVIVSARGPAGSRANISLRGSTSNQVLVLVDGIRVNDPLTGLVDFSLIPLEGVERIEVLRAGASAAYGPDAVGGVVNIVTSKRPGPTTVSFENTAYLPFKGYKDYGFAKRESGPDPSSLAAGQRLAVSASPRVGEAALALTAGASRSSNAYAFVDPNQETRSLQNADFAGGDLSLGLSTRALGGALVARATGVYQEKGVPGTIASPTPRARQTDTKADISARFATERLGSDLLDLEAAAFARFARIEYRDPDAGTDSDNRMAQAGVDLSQRAFVSDGASLAYGLKASFEGAAGSDFGAPRRFSGGLRFSPALVSGALTLRPAINYDYYSDFSPGGLGAMLGLAYRLPSGATLKADLSRSYRVPTFSDLYWPATGGAAGNPDLRPETAYEADIGFERALPGLEYEASAYVRYARDVILWQPGSDSVWRPSNYGAALYPGLDLEARFGLPGRHYAEAGYEFLYSYVLSEGYTIADDRRLPMTPVHSASGTIGYGGDGLSWSTTLKYRSLRYLKTANSAYLPSFFTLDAALKFRLTRIWEARAAVDNLFGERYQLVEGYPMPGTAIRLGVEGKL